MPPAAPAAARRRPQASGYIANSVVAATSDTKEAKALKIFMVQQLDLHKDNMLREIKEELETAFRSAFFAKELAAHIVDQIERFPRSDGQARGETSWATTADLTALEDRLLSKIDAAFETSIKRWGAASLRTAGCSRWEQESGVDTVQRLVDAANYNDTDAAAASRHSKVSPAGELERESAGTDVTRGKQPQAPIETNGAITTSRSATTASQDDAHKVHNTVHADASTSALEIAKLLAHSNNELARTNKELMDTNMELTDTNKELLDTNKELVLYNITLAGTETKLANELATVKEQLRCSNDRSKQLSEELRKQEEEALKLLSKIWASVEELEGRVAKVMGLSTPLRDAQSIHAGGGEGVARRDGEGRYCLSSCAE